MANNDQPTEEVIKKLIASSGYVFEQIVSDTIQNIGMFGYVETSFNYTDDETLKSREIDVCTSINYAYETGALSEGGTLKNDYFTLHLLIECKSNSLPFVLFSRSNPNSNNYPLLIGNPSTIYYGDGTGVPFLDYLFLNEIDFRNKRDWIATQFAQIVKKKKTGNNEGGETHSYELTHEGYYESITGLIKAASYIEKGFKSNLIATRHPHRQIVQLGLIYPILVLSGQLYECQVQGSDYNLVEVKQALLQRQHYSKEIGGEFNIHVTTKENLTTLLSQLHDEEQEMQLHIRKYIKRLESQDEPL